VPKCTPEPCSASIAEQGSAVHISGEADSENESEFGIHRRTGFGGTLTSKLKNVP